MNKNIDYLSFRNISVKAILFDKILFVGVLLYYIMMYSLPGSAVAKFVPLVTPLVGYFYLLFIGIGSDSKRFLLPCFFLIGFSVVALIYIGFDSRLNLFSATESIYFFSLPLLFLMSFRLINQGHNHFINSALFMFLAFQMAVILGQFMRMKTGFGLYAPAVYSDSSGEKYFTMLSGTFVNSNDLASISVMIALFFMINRKICSTLYKPAIFIVFLILIVTASRSSFVVFSILFLLLGSRGDISKRVALIIALFGIVYVYYILGLGHDQSVEIYRVVSRLRTIGDIVTSGITSDSSISMRLVSYLNFLNNLCNLGIGSVEYRNYLYFVSSLGPGYSLMGINPHSFIVEIGYWLGWLGLALFLVFLMFCLTLTSVSRWFLVVGVFVIMSSVSSSIIGSFIFILVFFCCLQGSRNRVVFQ